MTSNQTAELTRVPLGNIYAHQLTFDQAIERILALVDAGQGGYVVTPNVDHVVLASEQPAFHQAYLDAALSLVDGKPLLWLARAMGRPLPEKISGSDLVEPLMARAAARGDRVFLLGAKEGVGAKAADVLRAEHPSLNIVGVCSPPLGFEKDAAATATILRQLKDARAQIVLVALGSPKQELWMHQQVANYAPAIALGIGATLDFLAGEQARAPKLASDLGVEWLYRLSKDPKRLASRYLVRDRAIIGIAWRTWREHRL